MSDIRGRMGTPYDEALWSRMHTDLQPVQAEDIHGASGYFSTPHLGFDERLIDARTGQVWPNLRKAILKTLYTFWDKRYHYPELWSTVWIAGSALSHQWAADRGNADLDILIGVDHPVFLRYNPDFRGLAPAVIDQRFNKEFDDQLEPYTAKFLNAFEMTFYVNPGATDIRAIHPYAAYNLTTDLWTVPPIELPSTWNPYTAFPRDWWRKVNSEIVLAHSLVARYHDLKEQAAGYQVSSPGWVNAMSQLKRIVIPQASALFSDIHDGRRDAFTEGGNGYMDYANFRWQAHKNAGTTEALHAIKVMDVRAHIANQQNVYGEALLGAEDSTTVAALQHTPYGETAVAGPHLTSPEILAGQKEDDSKLPNFGGS